MTTNTIGEVGVGVGGWVVRLGTTHRRGGGWLGWVPPIVGGEGG